MILLPGVPKSGTSSMFSDLVQFEGVIPHSHKEINIPLNDQVMREQWYPKVNPNGKTSGALIDGSQNYCWDLENRDLEYLGKIPFQNIKSILMFRNPVFRSVSNYQMNQKQHGWTQSYEDAWFDYVTEKGQAIMGDYWEFYRRNVRIFGKKNVMVVIAEDYFANRKRVLESVQEFLALPGNVAAFHHEVISPMNDKPSTYHLSPVLYCELKQFF